MTTPRKTPARKGIPANAPQPQDHKQKRSAAARKAEAEAESGYVTIEQCGMELKIAVGGNMPLDAILLFQEDPETLQEYGIEADDPGRDAKLNLAATKLMLGPEQWSEFRKKRPTVDEFNEIGVKLEAISGGN
ncbi:hypothetical protein [Mycobacterium aquaticum]|uniref:Tail assembly chaperone n=1 Tax=Mycobacterium aquaticum TaxID=1927124 RepID=A0A1X0A053_9MYCO|nr:hypothetical protein [Mycobacterium aquaticum]ORA23400.1 hypothetical protein BST13_35190 [Mycobacterium aquaticum]